MRMAMNSSSGGQTDNPATQIVVPYSTGQIVRGQIDQSNGIIHTAYANGFLRCNF